LGESCFGLDASNFNSTNLPLVASPKPRQIKLIAKPSPRLSGPSLSKNASACSLLNDEPVRP
jgi:hypothetical protein